MAAKKMIEKARILASGHYMVRYEADETTNGQPLVMASNPELPGCMAQGKDTREAADNLEEARIDYILTLLEDGQSVPSPLQQPIAHMAKAATIVTGESTKTFVFAFSSASDTSFKPLMEKAAKKETRHLMGESILLLSPVAARAVRG